MVVFGLWGLGLNIKFDVQHGYLTKNGCQKDYVVLFCNSLITAPLPERPLRRLTTEECVQRVGVKDISRTWASS